MTTTTHSGSASTRSFWSPQTAVIEEIRPETPGVATYRLRTRSGGAVGDYAFQAGQFNMIYWPGFGEVAISMSGPPPSAGDDRFAAGWLHTIRQAGQVTSALAALRVGESVAIRGPYGKPWPLEACRTHDVILMAGGIGLAPLRPALYECLARRADFGRIVLLYGAKTSDGLLYRDEYARWEQSGLEMYLTVDRATRDWHGSVGVVPLLLDRLRLPQPDRAVVLCCGPEVMMRFAAASALARGLSPARIWVSLERHMQCAVGLCGHCQLGTELVCRDGPVFRWDRVQPLLQIHDL
jgi:NAD(P)H-flavin reductase